MRHREILWESKDSEIRLSAATLKRALKLALGLSPSERATLAHDVLASLDGPSDADATQAWETEILRRLDQLETGTAQTIEADEVLRRIDARLSRR